MMNSKKLFFIALISNVIIATIVFKSKSISADIAEIDQIYNRSQNEFAGITALMSAVSYNDIEGVRFFTKNNPEIVNKRNLGGASALHIACREKNYEIVKILIENGADINIVDNEGWTPLMRVASMGDEKITELLVQNDARIDIVNNFSETAIVHSAIANCTQCLKAIIDNRLIAKNFELGNQSYENILKKELETVKAIAIKYGNVEMENFANEIEKQINELIEIRAKKHYEQEKIELAQASTQAIEQAIAANQNTNNQQYKDRLEINNNQVSDQENANKNDNNIQNINKNNSNNQPNATIPIANTVKTENIPTKITSINNSSAINNSGNIPAINNNQINQGYQEVKKQEVAIISNKVNSNNINYRPNNIAAPITNTVKTENVPAKIIPTNNYNNSNINNSNNKNQGGQEIKKQETAINNRFNNSNVRNINDNINQEVSYQLVEKTENKQNKPTIIRINNEPINPASNIITNQIAIIGGGIQRNIDSKRRDQKNNVVASKNNVKSSNTRYYFNISKIAKIGDIAKQMQKSTMITKQPIVDSNINNVSIINSIASKGYYGNENYQQQNLRQNLGQNLSDKKPGIVNINQSPELQQNAITKFRDRSRLIIENRQIKNGKTVIYKTIYKLDKFDNNHSKKLIRKNKKNNIIATFKR